MTWVATAVSVGVSLLGSAMAPSGAGDWRAEARKSGQAAAQLEANKVRAFAALPEKAAALEKAASLSKLQADKDGAVARSEAIVAAAAAGVTGANVEQTIQQTESNVADVQGQIAKQRSAGMLQIEQDYEDIFWEAESNRSEISISGKNGGGAGAALASALAAGAGAWASQR